MLLFFVCCILSKFWILLNIEACYLPTQIINIFFFNLETLYFFFSLIVSVKTSSTILNKSGKNGHPFLISNLVERGKLPPIQ